MPTQRQEKFSQIIQSEIADIFLKEFRDDFGKILVTIADVEVTKDLKIAKVYYTVMPDESYEKVETFINQKLGYIRKLLGNRLKNEVRAIPELQFYYDNTAKEAQRIHELIDNLDIPPEQKDDNADEL